MNSAFPASLPEYRWPDEESEVRSPDTQGHVGTAWLLTPSKPGGTVSMWLVKCPNLHPWWQWWTVSVVHLREVRDLPSAKRRYPEAEYELQIRTVDPEALPNPDPDLVDEGYDYLEPSDVIEQFHNVTDAQAERIATAAIRGILDGAVSPNGDVRWKSFLRSCVHEQLGVKFRCS